MIITKIYETYGEKHTWIKFRNKFNTCKKQYNAVKKLTHKRTELGYFPNGSIDMTDDWWEERCKEWSGARKIKDKPVTNMDLMEEVFGSVQVTGAEGWNAQQGENYLDTMLPEDDDAASESRQNDPSPNHETNAPPGSNVPSGSNAPTTSNAPAASNVPRSSRKRRAGHAVADVIRDSIQSRDELLSHKNQLIESHPDYSCSQLRAMRVLHSLTSIRMKDRDFAYWETVDEYEHHGDQVNVGEEVEHTPYVPAGDRAMETLRDVITEKIGRGRQLPY